MTVVFYGDKNNHETAENNSHEIFRHFVDKEFREAYGFKFAECCQNCSNLEYTHIATPFCRRLEKLPGINDSIWVTHEMVCNFYNIPDTPRDTEQQRTWAEQVYKRDNYTCQHCGAKEIEPSQNFIDQEGRTITLFDPGLKLYAYHIKPYALFPKLAYNIDNGITLCHKCHVKAHKEYGGYALHKLPERQDNELLNNREET